MWLKESSISDSFPSLALFCPTLMYSFLFYFIFYYYPVNFFFPNERQKGSELAWELIIEGRETIIRIYHVRKKDLFQ